MSTEETTKSAKMGTSYTDWKPSPAQAHRVTPQGKKAPVRAPAVAKQDNQDPVNTDDLASRLELVMTLPAEWAKARKGNTKYTDISFKSVSLHFSERLELPEENTARATVARDA